MLAVEKQTGETPKALKDKPVLHPWLTWVYEAFWVIDSGRPTYQGSVGRLPLSEVRAYIELFMPESKIEAKQLLIRMIRGLDSVYVKIVNEEIARKMEQDRKDAERKAEEEAGGDRRR